MKKYIWLTGFFILALTAYVQIVSLTPDVASVKTIVKEAGIKNPENLVGEATTATLIFSLRSMLDKPGGYQSNDLLVKVNLYDNMPNWEKGVVFQARDLARSLRDDMSRSQSQSVEDKDLKEGAPKLGFDNDAWNPMASTESRYSEAADYFKRYQDRLIDERDQNTQFFARADNLRQYFQLVEKRLGSLSQRLSASVGQDRVNTDLANDPSAEQTNFKSSELFEKTAWLEIDDVFWEARGSTWALLHYMQAIEKDFDSVLRDKNALVSLRQVIRELKATQDPLWSPMVLNGSGFGLMANHSLAMANYISRANAAIIELRELLTRG